MTPRRRLSGVGHLAAALACVSLAACSGDGPTQPTPPTNSAPQITELRISSPRVEIGEFVELIATVTDAESPPDSFTYQWTATAAGGFTGAGRQVRWEPAVSLATPVTAEIRLTVIERYAVTVNGRPEIRENRATQTTSVKANNSPREVTDLSLTFLGDFSDSTKTAEYCVRNFSDSCRGKAEELRDIQQDRRLYFIEASSYRVDAVHVNDPRTQSVVFAPCSFTSRVLATGVVQPPAVGVCALTTIYEVDRWWLCTSNFCEPGESCNPTPAGGSSIARRLRTR